MKPSPYSWAPSAGRAFSPVCRKNEINSNTINEVSLYLIFPPFIIVSMESLFLLFSLRVLALELSSFGMSVDSAIEDEIYLCIFHILYIIVYI